MWPRRRKHEMRLFELTLLFDQNRSCRTRFARLQCLRSHGRAAFTTVKRSADEFQQTLVIDVSGRCYDEIAVRKLTSVKTNSSFVIESRNGFSRTFDRATEWLIRKVRQLSAKRGGRIPAAALTAYAGIEDRRRVLLADYQMHITKPVEAAELTSVVASLAELNGKSRQ